MYLYAERLDTFHEINGKEIRECVYFSHIIKGVGNQIYYKEEGQE